MGVGNFVDTALAAQNAVTAAQPPGPGSVFVGAYDERLSAYNRRFGLPGNWSDRVLERLRGPESMAGRHRLRQTLEKLGLLSR